MMFRYLLVTLALATLTPESEAGPLLRRRAQSAHQYSNYQQPTQPAATPAGEYTSSYTPVVTADSQATGEGQIVLASAVGDGLDEVNAKHSRGLRPFVRDEGLTQAAQACASFRADRLLFGHTSNDFAFVPVGASAGSAGCAAYPASYGWMSCCTYENYTYAGAAAVTGRDGKRYMHLFVR